MEQVLSCLRDSHDFGLSLTAALICAFTSASAMGLFRRCQDGGLKHGWRVALAATVAGGGVWATHFVAVLAYDPHLPMAFDVIGTVASLFCAILGIGLGLILALGGVVGRVAGGVVVGLAISAMHFSGVLAVRMQAHIDWDVPYVAAAVAQAVGLSVAAFLTMGLRRGPARWAAASLLLMGAIVGLHFTAMAAMTHVPDPSVALRGGGVSRPALAAAVTLVTLVLLLGPYAMLRIERRTQRRTLSTLRRSLDAMPGGIAVFDERDRLVAWNAAWGDIARRIGVEPREGLPRAVLVQAARAAGWIPPAAEDGQRVFEQLAGWREREGDDVRMPDGQWLRHQQFRLQGGGGVTTFADVTAQRELFQALTAAKEAAEAASAAKTAFLANISHEIRTPLNGMMGAAQLLGMRPLPIEDRKLVDMLETSGRLLNDLLSDLLDLSRIEAGALEIRPQPAEVAAIAADLEKVYAGAAAMKGLHLRLRVDDECGWVSCDANRLVQVLGNLVNNAIKFTDSGRVTLAIERQGSRLAFRVSDTGIGFGASQKRRLFERFSQADPSSTRARGGAGLGLAIASELVALMGGELDCVSKPGEGSTFMFALDLPSIASPQAGAPAGVAGRVLVVDDNAINRQVLATILGATGIEHAEAANGADALAAYAAETFTAISRCR